VFIFGNSLQLSSSIFEKKKKTFVLFLVAARKDEKDTRTKPKHKTTTVLKRKKKKKKKKKKRELLALFSLSLSSPVRLNRTTGPSSPHRFEACAPRQRRSLRLVLFPFPLYVREYGENNKKANPKP